MAKPRYNFAGRKVLVMGLGRFGGGVDVAEFAARAGARITVTDLAPADQLSDALGKLAGFNNIEFHLGSHDPTEVTMSSSNSPAGPAGLSRRR
ncbi:MAG: hypothetical protein ACYTE3_20690 [Planctomycetota bacterium]